MFPGHGTPIIGAGRIKQAFLETAAFLDGIIEQCLEGINAGLTLNQLMHSVKIPYLGKKRTYLPALIVQTLTATPTVSELQARSAPTCAPNAYSNTNCHSHCE